MVRYWSIVCVVLAFLAPLTQAASAGTQNESGTVIYRGDVPLGWSPTSLTVTLAPAPVTTVLDVCYTALNSLVADWQVTQALFSAGMGALELNPLVHSIGVDGYFFALTVYASGTCTTWSPWSAVMLWGLQTWTVNTHAILGTIQNVPLLVFLF